MSYLCDHCGENPVENSGDWCDRCEKAYREAWELNERNGWGMW